MNFQVFSFSTFLDIMNLQVFSFSILMIWFDDFWCYEPTGVFHFLLFLIIWTYKCFHFPLFLMSWTSRFYHFLFFLILWTPRCFHSHFRDPLFITILRFRFSWIFSSLGSLEILGLGLLLSGIIVWNWLAPWCPRKPSTWILPSPLFSARKDGVHYPWSHVLHGPLEFIKVHLWQLFPPGDVGLEVEATPGQRDRDLPGFVFGCPRFHVTYIENIFYQMPYIYMACYLLSTIPFRPLLSYKSDRLVVYSCTRFLSVAWMVKYVDDPYRNPNMKNKDHRVG